MRSSSFFTATVGTALLLILLFLSNGCNTAEAKITVYNPSQDSVWVKGNAYDFRFKQDGQDVQLTDRGWQVDLMAYDDDSSDSPEIAFPILHGLTSSPDNEIRDIQWTIPAGLTQTGHVFVIRFSNAGEQPFEHSDMFTIKNQSPRRLPKQQPSQQQEPSQEKASSLISPVFSRSVSATGAEAEAKAAAVKTRTRTKKQKTTSTTILYSASTSNPTLALPTTANAVIPSATTAIPSQVDPVNPTIPTTTVPVWVPAPPAYWSNANIPTTTTTVLVPEPTTWWSTTPTATYGGPVPEVNGPFGFNF